MRGPDVNSASRPQACPFVAFEDDRDRRSEAPDPKHRCFAVPNPEPRAIAHQQAYCLTPNFPSCAFFMDWAARAAAAPLAGSGAGFGAAAGTAGAYGNYAVPPDPAAIESPSAADPGGRNWAAPPPWVAEPDLQATELPPQPWSPPPSAWTPPQPEQLAALPEAEAVEADRDYDLSGEGRFSRPSRPAAATAYNPDPAILPVPAERHPGDDPLGRDRAAIPPLQPLAPLPPAARYAAPPLPAASLSSAETATPRQPYEAQSRLTGRPVDASSSSRFSPQARQPVKKRTEGEWSNPKRFGASPTLGGRMRLGGFSPVLVGAFALAIVALLVFLLPGFLSGGANPAATRTPAAATTTPVPTPTLAPTPQTYTVKGGDTLSAIAKGLGLTVEQMACFNNIKNINSVAIGQVLLVPPPDYVCPPKPSPTKK